jgi:hypothetical protein
VIENEKNLIDIGMFIRTIDKKKLKKYSKCCFWNCLGTFLLIMDENVSSLKVHSFKILKRKLRLFFRYQNHHNTGMINKDPKGDSVVERVEKEPKKI